MGVLAFGTGADMHTSRHKDECKDVTAAQFSTWANTVWQRDRWERWSLPKHTRHALHKKFRCAAGKGHRAAMHHAWRMRKHRFRHHQQYCYSGPTYEGRVSTFSGGLTAGGYQASEPGIALYETSTLGEMYRVSTGGRTSLLRHIDFGPAPWTGRAIDITLAGAAQLGGVTTDEWGVATMLPEGCY